MVREGYKQTEVGVIPVDWEVVSLGEIGAFKNGLNKGKEAFGHGSLFVNLMDVFGQSRLSSTDVKELVDSSSSEQEMYSLKEGDVLFIRSSVKPTGVGLTVVLKDDVPLATYSGFLIRYRSNGHIDNSFKEFCFSRKEFRKAIMAGASVSANTNINQTTLSQLQIPLPPTLTEQRAIAEALSDTDALLSALDALIGKKEAFKRGMMEGLLRGEIRLDGFEGEWETRPLGELAHIQTGTKNNQDKIATGKYPFFVRSPTIERIDSYSYEGEAILVPGEGNIGSIFHYVNGKFEVHQRVYKIDQFRDDVFPKFIHHYMSEYFGRHAMENSVKATVDSLRLPTFQEFTVQLPLLPEQRAIATVLSDLDAELAALRARRAKLAKVKGGMMEVLLGGEVRLV